MEKLESNKRMDKRLKANIINSIKIYPRVIRYVLKETLGILPKTTSKNPTCWKDSTEVRINNQVVVD